MELQRRALLTTFVGVLLGNKTLRAQELVSALVSQVHARLEPGPVGEHRVYFQGSTEGLKNLIVGSLALKPGKQPHPPHAHVDEELIVLVEATDALLFQVDRQTSFCIK
jgi:uncharacterized cupin superfamily protein